MTAREKEQLLNLNEKFEAFMESQEKTNHAIQNELMKLNRGLYGDEHNKHHGLIPRQEHDERRFIDHETRIIKLESFIDKKTIVLKTGVWVAIVVVVVVLLLVGKIDLNTIFNIFR